MEILFIFPFRQFGDLYFKQFDPGTNNNWASFWIHIWSLTLASQTQDRSSCFSFFWHLVIFLRRNLWWKFLSRLLNAFDVANIVLARQTKACAVVSGVKKSMPRDTTAQLWVCKNRLLAITGSFPLFYFLPFIFHPACFTQEFTSVCTQVEMVSWLHTWYESHLEVKLLPYDANLQLPHYFRKIIRTASFSSSTCLGLADLSIITNQAFMSVKESSLFGPLPRGRMIVKEVHKSLWGQNLLVAKGLQVHSQPDIRIFQKRAKTSFAKVLDHPSVGWIQVPGL